MLLTLAVQAVVLFARGGPSAGAFGTSPKVVGFRCASCAPRLDFVPRIGIRREKGGLARPCAHAHNVDMGRRQRGRAASGERDSSLLAPLETSVLCLWGALGSAL